MKWSPKVEATASEHDSAHKSGLSYSISYGFLGGPAHSRKLRSILKRLGLKPAGKIEEADVIIAHSAGCWLIPAGSTARLVVFIGMPLSQDDPAKAFRQANAQNIISALKDFKMLTWLAGAVFDLYYAVKQPGRNWAISRKVKNVRPSILPHAEHIYIANRHDPWPRSKQLGELLKSKDWSFISLPGSHADIWKHPDRYTSIINYYARILV